MATVHSYVRFSTADQLEGDSLRRQSEGAADFCERHGHKLSNLVFNDLGKSSYRGKKQKALARFLEAIDEGVVLPGDILLIEAVDRLSRKGIRETQDLVNRILNAGIDIAILTPLEKVYRAADKNDIGGTIELAAFAYSAHIFSQQLSGRLTEAWIGARRKAKETGKPIPARTPTWVLKTEDGNFDTNPEQTPKIEYIFKRTIDGIGVPKLCAELNAKFEPFQGKPWNKTLVRQILRSRSVRGEYQPHALDANGKRQPIGDPIIGYYPAIVSEETWLAANAATDNRVKERGPSGKYVNLFVGLVHHVIDNCAAHIYTYQQTRADGRKVTIRRWKSFNASSGVVGASTATVDVNQFEKAVLTFLKEVDASTLVEGQQKPEALQLAAAQGDLNQKVRRLEELKSDLKNHSKEAVSILMESITELTEEINEQREQIRKMTVRSNSDVSSNIANVKRLMELPMTPENRQKLREQLKRVISQINIVPVKLGEKRHSPVATAIEILFKAGHKRTTIICNGSIVSIENPTPTELPFHERPDFYQWLPKFYKAMKHQFGGKKRKRN